MDNLAIDCTDALEANKINRDRFSGREMRVEWKRGERIRCKSNQSAEHALFQPKPIGKQAEEAARNNPLKIGGAEGGEGRERASLTREGVLPPEEQRRQVHRAPPLRAGSRRASAAAGAHDPEPRAGHRERRHAGTQRQIHLPARSAPTQLSPPDGTRRADPSAWGRPRNGTAA